MVKEILHQIPHIKPYRFVDNIIEINENQITGNCFLPKDSFFYKGHFPKAPITPGFIITEVMAQIGILCLGLFLTKNDTQEEREAFLTSAEIKFHNVSYPNDTITVVSKKVYFRLNKLKCQMEAINQKGDLLCSGYMAGMIKRKTDPSKWV